MLSLTQFTHQNGESVTKDNDLFITETERDETIHIDEPANGSKKIIIDFFWWLSITDQRTFAFSKSIEATEGLPPPPPPEPEGKLIQGMKGLLFGAIALSLLGSKGK